MKTIILIFGFTLFFSFGIIGQQCEEFGSLSNSSYSVGDLMYSSTLFQVKADSYFTGGTCGTNGASWVGLTSNTGFSMNGNISCLFDCSNKIVTYKIANIAGQCFSVRVNGQNCGDYSDQSGITNLDSSAGGVIVQYNSGTKELTFTGEVCEIEIGGDYAKIESVCTAANLSDLCTDYVSSSSPGGIYLGVGDTTLVVNAINQNVLMDIYGIFNSWESIGYNQIHQTLFKVNNSGSVSLETIFNNQPYILNGVSITVDTNSLNYHGWTSGTLIFEGNIQTITMEQFESGILKVCKESASMQTCDDLSVFNAVHYQNEDIIPSIVNGEINVNLDTSFLGYAYLEARGPDGYLLGGNVEFDLGGVNKEVSFQFGGLVSNIYGISVNGSASVLLSSLPATVNGVLVSYNATTLVLTFSGFIDQIVLSTLEVFLKQVCTNSIEVLDGPCVEFSNSHLGFEGIYLGIGDTTFNVVSAYKQTISMGIYGGVDDWNTISSMANQTYFSVNDGDSVSLAVIYNNQPYSLTGVSVTIDTNSLNVSGSTSGTIIFSGIIENIKMIQFESGLLFMCREELEEIQDECEIFADFSTSITGLNGSFSGLGNGSNHSWSFGDGTTSQEINPNHEYTTPGIYEVCYISSDGNCSKTFCQNLEFVNLTNENILTPNGDGFDDYFTTNCSGMVTIYDRNGLIITETDSETWEGTDANGNLVPMGMYILECENGTISSVTVIR